MDSLAKLASHPRVTVRRAGSPDAAGSCVVYWMQRAQRGVDNPALDIAVEAANAVGKPAVVFFAPVPFYPHANLRHYRFLSEGIADLAADVRAGGAGFVSGFLKGVSAKALRERHKKTPPMTPRFQRLFITILL
jgi:deoxyribodipyrimidine photo-lyase